MDLSRVGLKRFLDLNEMEELRNDAYINSKIAKEKLKRWIGPFTIHQVHSNGVVEPLNSNSTGSFKVNDHRLKPFAVEALRIPPYEAGEATGPSSPTSQRRYETRRPPTTLGVTTSRPKSLVRRSLTKARTSGPGESSRASEPLEDYELPSALSPESIIRRPMVTTPPIEGNSNCRARPFHSKLHFDQEAMQQQPELRYSYGLLKSPIAIHFNIDGCPGVLEARHIVEALQIPYEGTSTDLVLLQKELPPGMLLVDVGFYFGPHHLIMASLIHFEEKVHRKKLQRVDTIPLLFPRLLCQIFEYLGFPTEPWLQRHRLCRERLTLDKWNQLAGYSAHSGALPIVAPPVPPQQEHGELPADTTPPVPTPEATSAAPPTTSTVPPIAPTTSEPSITISASEFCTLVLSFRRWLRSPIAPIEDTTPAEVQIPPPQDEPPIVTATLEDASSPPEAPTVLS
ncbi:hypothetical protein CK203_115423 [Vitis vinifera]|uniref:Uncharacterized protein n=1 Tax=Vitis vinifera TaxID=29760 RepID=A0A438D1H0_VITVI|nr:hypothetical protein CK203_115423 [Vitis vinifera]